MDFFNLQNNSQNNEEFDFNFICQDYGQNQAEDIPKDKKITNSNINISPIEPTSQSEANCFWNEQLVSQDYNFNFTNNNPQPDKNDFYSNIKRNSSDLENEINDLKTILKSFPKASSTTYNFNIPQNTKNTRRNLTFEETLYKIKEEKEPEVTVIEEKNMENKILYSFSNTNKKPQNFINYEKKETPIPVEDNTDRKTSSILLKNNQEVPQDHDKKSIYNINDSKINFSVANCVNSDSIFKAECTKSQTELFKEFSEYLNEKKQEIKKINDLSKLFDSLYVKLEDFKIKVPKLLEEYLYDFSLHLEKYNELLNLDETQIDKLIEENERMMVTIDEKYKLN
jgi:hypothetical protein